MQTVICTNLSWVTSHEVQESGQEGFVGSSGSERRSVHGTLAAVLGLVHLLEEAAEDFEVSQGKGKFPWLGALFDVREGDRPLGSLSSLLLGLFKTTGRGQVWEKAQRFDDPGTSWRS